MADKLKLLSESVSGKGVLIAATATPGTAVHITPAGYGSIDKVTLYASNIHSADVAVTVEWGEATATKKIVKTITASSGNIELIKDIPVGAGITIAAFAGTTNVVTINGNVIKTKK